MLQNMRSLLGKNERTRNTPGSNTTIKALLYCFWQLGEMVRSFDSLANRASAVQSVARGGALAPPALACR